MILFGNDEQKHSKMRELINEGILKSKNYEGNFLGFTFILKFIYANC